MGCKRDLAPFKERLNGVYNAVKRSKLKPNLLVLPVHRRHACLAGPPASTCFRNRPQNKPQSPVVIPEFSGAAPAVTENIRNLRRKAGWPSHRSPDPLSREWRMMRWQEEGERAGRKGICPRIKGRTAGERGGAKGRILRGRDFPPHPRYFGDWVGCKYFFKVGRFPSFLCYNSSQQPPPLCAFSDAYGRVFLCLEGGNPNPLLELRKRWPRRPLRSVASRQRSRNFGGMPRLAADIPE